MLALVAVTGYFVFCLALCVGVALYVAFPARGRTAPGRLRRTAPGASRASEQTTDARTDDIPRRTARGRRPRGRQAPQRG